VEGTPPPIFLQDNSGNTITVAESLGIEPGLVLGDQGAEVIGIGDAQSVFFGGGGLIGTPEDQQMIKNMYPGARTPEDDLEIYIKYDTEVLSLSDYIALPSEIPTITEYQKVGIDTYTITIKLTDKAIEKGTTIRVDNEFLITTDFSSNQKSNGKQYITCDETIPSDGSYGPYPETQNDCTSVTINIAEFIYEYFRSQEINGDYRVKIPIFLQETQNPTDLTETTTAGTPSEPKLKEIDISENLTFNLIDPFYDLLA
jgi:hypothetical protein